MIEILNIVSVQKTAGHMAVCHIISEYDLCPYRFPYACSSAWVPWTWQDHFWI